MNKIRSRGNRERDELVLASVAVDEDLSKCRARQRVASLTTSNESNKVLWGRRGEVWGKGGGRGGEEGRGG